MLQFNVACLIHINRRLQYMNLFLFHLLSSIPVDPERLNGGKGTTRKERTPVHSSSKSFPVLVPTLIVTLGPEAG
jgi:hypothetical protein